MKKTLFLAAFGLLSLGAQAQAMTVTDNAQQVERTINLSENFSQEGSAIAYSASTGVLSGYSSTQAFTLNNVNTAAADWTSGTFLVYNSAISTTGATQNNSCGLIVDGTDGVLRGSWSGGKWNDGNKTEDDATIAKSDITTTLTVTLHNTEGVTLLNASGNQLYRANDLKATGSDVNSIYINKNLVGSVTLTEKLAATEYTVSTGSWQKTFAADKAYVLTSSNNTTKHTIMSDNANLGKGAIVVGGNTQAFLQSWDNKRNLEILDDIYIGETTYTEDNYNGVALRFGNNGSKDGVALETILGGSLYIVEDAKIKASNTNKVSINGAVTDAVDGVRSGSSLTVIGQGIEFNGQVSLKGISVNNSGNKTTFTNSVDVESMSIAANTTVASTGTTDEGASKLNAGSITFAAGAKLEVTGSLTLDANAIKLAEGLTFNSADAVTLISMQGDSALTVTNVDAWSGASTYLFGGAYYTSTLAQSGSLLQLAFTKALTLEVGSASLDMAEQILTLNVDANLDGVTALNLTLSDEALNSIVGYTGEVTLNIVGLDSTGADVANVSFYEAYTGEANGKYLVQYIPEPATATLSLLALAGLAARRRRR